MEKIDEKAAELMEALRAIGEHYIQWQEEVANEKLGDLSRHDAAVLVFVGQDGACTMSEIAQKLRLSVSSATLIVDRIVKRGLVVRERSERDRRVVHVALSVRGEQMYRAVQENLLHIGRAMLQALDESEQDTLLLLYRKIGATLPVREP
ncbi:MAG TPA: MarR family transcriptional regulator [Bacteroidota bacterium]|nr:MarR family transcriptional regulator [Bacteroidota bacterium]